MVSVWVRDRYEVELPIAACYQSRRRRRALCLFVGVFSGIVVTSPCVAQLDAPWLEYHPGIGCPPRETLREELMKRLSYRAPSTGQRLSAHIEYVEGQYVGRVWLGAEGSSSPRQIQNESCNQVVHALALMGALLLEDDRKPSAAAEPAPRPTPTPSHANVVHSSTTLPSSSRTSERRAQPRPIQQLTLGPWLALTSDGLVTPDLLRFGARLGAVATFHPKAHGFQQALRLSLANVKSGTLASAGERTAEIQWTSVRLDACHGWGARQLSSLSACVLLDVGQYEGTGRVGGDTYERSALLGRAGATLYVRYALISGLALHAELGAVLPFARPSFVFVASNDLPAETIHRVRQIGPVADLGLELHFW